jgi:hypothetical protein
MNFQILSNAIKFHYQRLDYLHLNSRAGKIGDIERVRKILSSDVVSWFSALQGSLACLVFHSWSSILLMRQARLYKSSQITLLGYLVN